MWAVGLRVGAFACERDGVGETCVVEPYRASCLIIRQVPGSQ